MKIRLEAVAAVVSVAVIGTILWHWSRSEPKQPGKAVEIATPDTVTEATTLALATRIVERAEADWIAEGISSEEARRIRDTCVELLPSLMTCDYQRYSESLREMGAVPSDRALALANAMFEIASETDRPKNWAGWSRDERIAWLWTRYREIGSGWQAIDLEASRGWLGAAPKTGAVRGPMVGMLSMFDGEQLPATLADDRSRAEDFAWVEVPVRFESGANGVLRIQIRRSPTGQWYPRRAELLGSTEQARLLL